MGSEQIADARDIFLPELQRFANEQAGIQGSPVTIKENEFNIALDKQFANVGAGRDFMRERGAFGRVIREEGHDFHLSNFIELNPAPPPPPPPDPIAAALDQLANIFKPPPPPPSPPAPVRQSVATTGPTVSRSRVNFGSFAAAAAPSGGDFTRRNRNKLGAGI